MKALLALHSMLVSLGPHSLDTEAPEARVDRMMVLASAIHTTVEEFTCTGAHAVDSCTRQFRGHPDELAMGLFTIGRFESYFSQHVHEDRCRVDIGECDFGRAKSNFQVQATSIVPLEVWRTLGGTDQDSTDRAARAAATVLAKSWHCGSPRRVFRGYATSRCDGQLKDAQARADFYTRKLAEYRRLKATEQQGN